MFQTSLLCGAFETNVNLGSKLKNSVIVQHMYSITLVTKRIHMWVVDHMIKLFVYVMSSLKKTFNWKGFQSTRLSPINKYNRYNIYSSQKLLLDFDVGGRGYRQFLRSGRHSSLSQWVHVSHPGDIVSTLLMMSREVSLYQKESKNNTLPGTLKLILSPPFGCSLVDYIFIGFLDHVGDY